MSCTRAWSVTDNVDFLDILYRLGSRFRVNETSLISERYIVQTKDAMKQKSLVLLGQRYCSMIE